MMKQVEAYTDGACSGNPGPGGWGVVLMYGDHQKNLSGFEAQTTNNRMELQAAIQALTELKMPCEVNLYTDSQYVKQGIEQWIHGWLKNQWRTADKKEVKNKDLWQQLWSAQQRHRVQWHWVKGHADCAGNVQADLLARQAILQHQECK